MSLFGNFGVGGINLGPYGGAAGSFANSKGTPHGGAGRYAGLARSPALWGMWEPYLQAMGLLGKTDAAAKPPVPMGAPGLPKPARMLTGSAPTGFGWDLKAPTGYGPAGSKFVRNADVAAGAFVPPGQPPAPKGFEYFLNPILPERPGSGGYSLRPIVPGEPGTTKVIRIGPPRGRSKK